MIWSGNPLSQFTVKVTSPLLKPLRRVIPGFRGIDIASLVLAYAFSLLTILVILAIAGAGINAAMLFWFGLLKLLLVTLQMYFLTLILQVILSWVSSGGQHPLMGPLWSINEPLLRPFRKLVPPLGGFDLSPLFAFILLQFLSYLVPLPGLLR